MATTRVKRPPPTGSYPHVFLRQADPLPDSPSDRSREARCFAAGDAVQKEARPRRVPGRPCPCRSRLSPGAEQVLRGFDELGGLLLVNRLPIEGRILEHG